MMLVRGYPPIIEPVGSCAPDHPGESHAH
jgi:hypothetical protein